MHFVDLHNPHKFHSITFFLPKHVAEKHAEIYWFLRLKTRKSFFSHKRFRSDCLCVRVRERESMCVCCECFFAKFTFHTQVHPNFSHFASYLKYLRIFPAFPNFPTQISQSFFRWKSLNGVLTVQANMLANVD